jgi:hypothetical protein
MTTAGFWEGGSEEYRRATEKHITEVRKRLESCKSEDRERIAAELDRAVEELKASEDPHILW